MWWVSFALFKIVSLSFISLSMMYLGMDLKSSNLNSLNGQINIFHQSWYVFGHYFLKYSLCPLFAFSFPSEISISIMYILVQLMGFHSSQKVFSFFFIFFFFLYLPLDNFNRHIFTFVDSLLAQICCWGSSMNFPFPWLYFSTQEFLFSSFLYFAFLLIFFFLCETLCSYIPLTLQTFFSVFGTCTIWFKYFIYQFQKVDFFKAVSINCFLKIHLWTIVSWGFLQVTYKFLLC